MKLIKLLSLFTTIALIFAACGGDDALSADEKALADELADEILSDDAPITEEQATCYGENIVRRLGADKARSFQESEDSGDTNLSEKDARAVANSLGDCVDLSKLWRDTFADIGLEEDQVDCLVAELDRLGIEALVPDLMGESDSVFDDLGESCDLGF